MRPKDQETKRPRDQETKRPRGPLPNLPPAVPLPIPNPNPNSVHPLGARVLNEHPSSGSLFFLNTQLQLILLFTYNKHKTQFAHYAARISFQDQYKTLTNLRFFSCHYRSSQCRTKVTTTISPNMVANLNILPMLMEDLHHNKVTTNKALLLNKCNINNNLPQRAPAVDKVVSVVVWQLSVVVVLWKRVVSYVLIVCCSFCTSVLLRLVCIMNSDPLTLLSCRRRMFAKATAKPLAFQHSDFHHATRINTASYLPIITYPQQQANNTTLSKVFAIRLVHLCQSYRLVHRLIPFKMIESKNSTFASASIHTFSFLSHPVFHIPGLRLFSDGWITQVFCFQLVFRDGWIWMVKIR
ncbi:hypothetical protein EYC84_011344 [Monilinia fructicola]|uniref:Uncharacterized protein n=1 Tax=Monilinia fructicola TaxID=38448 RepID=A0A5M9J522_MONFR|nr:hypothetical protein EYC84_011344 [Monilinia fructicola]